MAPALRVAPLGGKPLGMSWIAASRLLAVVALLTATALGCASLQGVRAYRSGTAALARGQTTLAISELERASELMPDNSDVYNQLGLGHARAGQLDQAVAAFERAGELDCGNQAAVVNLALAKEQRSRMAAQGLGEASAPASGQDP